MTSRPEGLRATTPDALTKYYNAGTFKGVSQGQPDRMKGSRGGPNGCLQQPLGPDG